MRQHGDARESAQTYLNYLRAYRRCCDSLGYADQLSLVTRQKQLPWFSKACRVLRRPDDLRPYLFRGWLTLEFMQAVPLTESSAPVLGAAMWLPIQAYYACHGVGLAAACAIGCPPAETTHACFSRVVSANMIASGALLYPFNCRCCGDPTAGRCETYVDMDITADEVATVSNLLRRDLSLEDAVLLVAKSLRTTRRKELLRLQREERERKNRKRLSGDMRRAICQRLVATTCVDLLRRMRLRANYQDPHVFLAGFVGEDATEFCRLVLWISDTICCQFDQVIQHKLGKERYGQLRGEFGQLREQWHALSVPGRG